MPHELRRQQVLDVVAAIPGAGAAEVIDALVAPLRAELASLMSEEGFQFLFERCMHQTARSYAWIEVAPGDARTASLAALAAMLAQHAPEQARLACTELLFNLVELVISLIGEPLTIGILRSAWGNDAFGALNEDIPS